MVILLFRKMVRDIKKNLAAYMACILIIATGFCGYSVLSVSGAQMDISKEKFYQSSHFTDGFTLVAGAPASVSRDLEKIEGIRGAEGRLVKTVTVEMETYGEELYQLKLISFRKDGLNIPNILQGSLPDGPKELSLGSGFYESHGYQPQDNISLIAGGKAQSFSVSGSGISPENIYLVKTIQDLMPDPSHYDAAFMEYEAMAAFLSMEGMANEFLFTLDDGVRVEDVKEKVEYALKPYGCYQVYGRDKELSCAVLQTELDQMKRMAKVIPFLFLAVAAVILYISLYRMIRQQRIQIGILMAQGIGFPFICLHYMGYGFFTGLLGGALGGILGNLCAGPMVDFYMEYFRLPAADVSFHPMYVISGALTASLFCGSVAACNAAGLRFLSPAEALRPEMPDTFHTKAERHLDHLKHVLSETSRMGVRSVLRNARRSALSVVGISFAFMMTATLVSMNSLIQIFMFDYYEKTQNQDISVHFDRPVNVEDAYRSVQSGDITEAEVILSFPASLKSAKGKADCTIQGNPEDTHMIRLYDENGKPVSPRQGALTLSSHTAKLLGVKSGDQIQVEIFGSETKTFLLDVAKPAAQYIGDVSYMTLPDAQRYSGYPDACTSILVKGSSATFELLTKQLKEAAHVSAIESKNSRVTQMRSMMGIITLLMGYMVAVGVTISFAIIYVTSLISFEELKREIAIMQMLGVRDRSCLKVVSSGQWLLAACGILAGIPMTVAASRLLARSMGTELYTIPDFVDVKSLFLTALLTCGVVFLNSTALSVKLKRMSPVDLLRQRE